MDVQSTSDDFVQRLVGRRVSYVSLFLNSLRICLDRELGEKTGFFIWLEPVWHLGSRKGILVGSRQAQIEEREARAALNLLVEQIRGKQIESVSIEVLTNDIDMRLSDGYWVRTFVSDATDDESWYVCNCQSEWVVTGSPKGLRFEEQSRSLHGSTQDSESNP